MGTPREGLKLPSLSGAPQGQSHASPSDGLLQAGLGLRLRRRPTYPVLLLPALSISLLSLHLQGDGGQAVLCAHQFLGQRRLLGLLQ